VERIKKRTADNISVIGKIICSQEDPSSAHKSLSREISLRATLVDPVSRV